MSDNVPKGQYTQQLIDEAEINKDILTFVPSSVAF